MRTLLRHTSTGQYFQNLNHWTPDRDEAHDFGIVARAVRFARKLALPELELVVWLDEKQAAPTSFEAFWRGVLGVKTNGSGRSAMDTVKAAL